MEATPFNENAKLALEEMRLQMGRVFQASDSLDQKANFLLGAAGLVIALAAALMPRLMIGSWPKTALLVIAAILYALMIYFVLRALVPAKFMGPIQADYKVLEQYVLCELPDNALANILAGYTKRIDENKAVNAAKADSVKRCMWLFAAILPILLIAAAI